VAPEKDANYLKNNFMNKQEENWKIMHMLNMAWSEATKLESEDRSFLLERAETIRVKMEKEAEDARRGGAQNVVAPSDLDIK
jgi:hypothetical protein